MLSPSHGHLPRLSAEFYRGRAWVHWSMTIRDRGVGWLDPRFDAAFRACLAGLGVERAIGCLACCLMPDHVHLLLCGLAQESDQRLLVRALRRDLGPALAPFAWQKQPYDKVLRGDERSKGAVMDVAHYIVENPARAGLVRMARDWPHRGAWLPNLGWLDPWEADFRVRFWNGYNQIVQRS